MEFYRTADVEIGGELWYFEGELKEKRKILWKE